MSANEATFSTSAVDAVRCLHCRGRLSAAGSVVGRACGKSLDPSLFSWVLNVRSHCDDMDRSS